MASDSTALFGPGSRPGAPGEKLRILVIDENREDRERVAEALRAGLPGASPALLLDPVELAAVLERGRLRRRGRGPPARAGSTPSWFSATVRERQPGRPRDPVHGDGQRGARGRGHEGGVRRLRPEAPPPLPALASAIRSALEDADRRRISRESEMRYQKLFEGVPVGLYRSTPTGQVLDANPALVRMLGFPSREVMMAGNLCEVYVDHKAHDRMRRQLDGAGEVRDLEVCWRRYAGQLIWVRENIRAGARPDGPPAPLRGRSSRTSRRAGAPARSSRNPTSSATRSSRVRARASSSTTARCGASSGTATWRS